MFHIFNLVGIAQKALSNRTANFQHRSFVLEVNLKTPHFLNSYSYVHSLYFHIYILFYKYKFDDTFTQYSTIEKKCFFSIPSD